MARSHHRKKHKQHLQQFRQKNDTSRVTAKIPGAYVFATGGAIFGLVVAYMADGSAAWVIAGFIVGAALGYLLGNWFDKGRDSTEK